MRKPKTIDGVFDPLLIEVLHRGLRRREKALEERPSFSSATEMPMLIHRGASRGRLDEVDFIVRKSFPHRATEGDFGAKPTFVRSDSRPQVLPLVFVPNLDFFGCLFF